MKAKINFILILLCLFSGYVNYKVYMSNRIQIYLLNDYNTNQFTLSESVVENIETNIPNLSETALSLKALKSRYYLVNKKYNKAKKLLVESLNDSLRIGMTEALLSELFSKTSIIDSAKYYAKKAHEMLPGNAYHFRQYAKILADLEEIDTLRKAFNNIKNKIDPQVWRIYMSVLVAKNIKDSAAIKVAKDARKKYGKNHDQIRLLSNYILHGYENVTEAQLNYEEGSRLFKEKDYKKAAYHFDQAINYHPDNYIYYENSGLCHFLNENYSIALDRYNYVIDNKENDDGKAEYFKALTLIQMESENKEEICSLLYYATIREYENSFKTYNEYCR